MSASTGKPAERPAVGRFTGFDHVHMWVSNAKQASQWYCLRFGFHPVAYRGLETGSRDVATHVIRCGNIFMAFSSPLNPDSSNEIAKRLAVTGDATKDVAFTVLDCEALYHHAVSKGAKGIQEPVKISDEHGEVILATIQTYGDTTHTLVQRENYKGVFLPGYQAVDRVDPLAALLPSPNLNFIDHVVGNQPDLKMEEAVSFYERCLGFHRFWSVDDKQIHTEYSSLRSIVVCDYDERVKMPVNEPAMGKRKSQIQEYIDYHGGAGVQHIAINVPDVIHTLRNLRSRGAEFLTVPASYYTDLRQRLAKSPVKVKEDLAIIEELNLLVDFDDHGYLLQIFTKPVQDRPTLFFEFIQRNNHQGFGAGNFKALFESIERDQALRGNLTNL